MTKPLYHNYWFFEFEIRMQDEVTI